MKLYRPCYPFIVNQKFAENQACIEARDGVLMTTLKVVSKVGGTCPVGYRELYPLLGLKGHPGLDIFAPTNTPLYACTDGEVISVSKEAQRGLGLDVVTEPDVTGIALKWRYWHLAKLNVTIGQKVEIGDLVGWADSTGFSAGSHLHFECKKVKKDLKGDWVNIEPSNGYFGAFNFEPLISEEYAKDYKAKLILIADQVAKAKVQVDELTLERDEALKQTKISLISRFLSILAENIISLFK